MSLEKNEIFQFGNLWLEFPGESHLEAIATVTGDATALRASPHLHPCQGLGTFFWGVVFGGASGVYERLPLTRPAAEVVVSDWPGVAPLCSSPFFFFFNLTNPSCGVFSSKQLSSYL